jgi:hypothetical protein
MINKNQEAKLNLLIEAARNFYPKASEKIKEMKLAAQQSAENTTRKIEIANQEYEKNLAAISKIEAEQARPEAGNDEKAVKATNGSLAKLRNRLKELDITLDRLGTQNQSSGALKDQDYLVNVCKDIIIEHHAELIAELVRGESLILTDEMLAHMEAQIPNNQEEAQFLRKLVSMAVLQAVEARIEEKAQLVKDSLVYRNISGFDASFYPEVDTSDKTKNKTVKPGLITNDAISEHVTAQSNYDKARKSLEDVAINFGIQSQGFSSSIATRNLFRASVLLNQSISLPVVVETKDNDLRKLFGAMRLYEACQCESARELLLGKNSNLSTDMQFKELLPVYQVENYDSDRDLTTFRGSLINNAVKFGQFFSRTEIPSIFIVNNAAKAGSKDKSPIFESNRLVEVRAFNDVLIRQVGLMQNNLEVQVAVLNNMASIYDTINSSQEFFTSANVRQVVEYLANNSQLTSSDNVFVDAVIRFNKMAQNVGGDPIKFNGDNDNLLQERNKPCDPNLNSIAFAEVNLGSRFEYFNANSPGSTKNMSFFKWLNSPAVLVDLVNPEKIARGDKIPSTIHFKDGSRIEIFKDRITLSGFSVERLKSFSDSGVVKGNVPTVKVESEAYHEKAMRELHSADVAYLPRRATFKDLVRQRTSTAIPRKATTSAKADENKNPNRETQVLSKSAAVLPKTEAILGRNSHSVSAKNQSSPASLPTVPAIPIDQAKKAAADELAGLDTDRSVGSDSESSGSESPGRSEESPREALAESQEFKSDFARDTTDTPSRTSDKSSVDTTPNLASSPAQADIQADAQADAQTATPQGVPAVVRGFLARTWNAFKNSVVGVTFANAASTPITWIAAQASRVANIFTDSATKAVAAQKPLSPQEKRIEDVERQCKAILASDLTKLNSVHNAHLNKVVSQYLDNLVTAANNGVDKNKLISDVSLRVITDLSTMISTLQPIAPIQGYQPLSNVRDSNTSLRAATGYVSDLLNHLEMINERNSALILPIVTGNTVKAEVPAAALELNTILSEEAANINTTGAKLFAPPEIQYTESSEVSVEEFNAPAEVMEVKAGEPNVEPKADANTDVEAKAKDTRSNVMPSQLDRDQTLELNAGAIAPPAEAPPPNATAGANAPAAASEQPTTWIGKLVRTVSGNLPWNRASTAEAATAGVAKSEQRRGSSAAEEKQAEKGEKAAVSLAAGPPAALNTIEFTNVQKEDGFYKNKDQKMAVLNWCKQQGVDSANFSKFDEKSPIKFKNGAELRVNSEGNLVAAGWSIAMMDKFKIEILKGETPTVKVSIADKAFHAAVIGKESAAGVFHGPDNESDNKFSIFSSLKLYITHAINNVTSNFARSDSSQPVNVREQSTLSSRSSRDILTDLQSETKIVTEQQKVANPVHHSKPEVTPSPKVEIQVLPTTFDAVTSTVSASAVKDKMQEEVIIAATVKFPNSQPASTSTPIPEGIGTAKGDEKAPAEIRQSVEIDTSQKATYKRPLEWADDQQRVSKRQSVMLEASRVSVAGGSQHPLDVIVNAVKNSLGTVPILSEEKQGEDWEATLHVDNKPLTVTVSKLGNVVIDVLAPTEKSQSLKVVTDIVTNLPPQGEKKDNLTVTGNKARCDIVVAELKKVGHELQDVAKYVNAEAKTQPPTLK